MEPSTLPGGAQRVIAHMERNNKSVTSIQDYGRTYERFFCRNPILAEMLGSAGPQEWYRAITEFLAINVTPGTRKKYRTHLQKLTSINKIDVDWDEIANPKVSLEAPRVLDDNEAVALREYLKNIDQKYAYLFDVFAATGLRGAELFSLTFQRISQTARGRYYITVMKDGSHSSTGRIVPIEDSTYNTLRQLGLPIPFSLDSFRKAMANGRRHLGLPKEVTPHNLRKVFLTRAHKKGVDPHTIATLAGHKDLRVLHRYIGHTPDDLYDKMKGESEK